MKAADLRKLSESELNQRVNDAREALFRLKLKQATQQLENLSSLGKARRDLARALTVQNARGVAL